MANKYSNLLRLALAERQDLRDTLGPDAYSVMEIPPAVQRDIYDKHFIEAYALTDQYVETLLKHTFYEILGPIGSVDKKNAVETVLKCAKHWQKINSGYFEIYRDFKSTRDDLIHKSIYGSDRAKGLQNHKKLATLPELIIKESEEIFMTNIAATTYSIILNELKMLKSLDEIKKLTDDQDFKNALRLWVRISSSRGKEAKVIDSEYLALVNNAIERVVVENPQLPLIESIKNRVKPTGKART